MLRLTALSCTLFLCLSAFSKNIVVANAGELAAANEAAKPGDVVILKNGTWNDILIRLTCSGTKEQPISFKAETAGKVIISGVSSLSLGGNYLVVDGMFFKNGYSPSASVIDFKVSNKELANNCRVTNCVVMDFNKPKRMWEDQWVAFYGKNNRLDHCSFFDKKNMGVLLAVILTDDRSRENFHSIDHNRFGRRPPLGSNGGEIIRVGVSEHCQFNSNTQIRDNFFDQCDGETEVISIKSGANVVSGNVFKECQGSVVLRHGNYNTVTDNVFLGNGKEATGGVRIINKGQWVMNNFFYKCRGESFRSPLAIMNGIPNSPANRYVQVTDAVVMNNTFVDCAPMSLGEGSDKERSLPPSNVLFAKNIFYNNSDEMVYRAWDDISGIRFSENKISKHFTQNTVKGFERASFGSSDAGGLAVPTAGRGINRIGIDSLMKLDKDRLPELTPAPGFSGLPLISNLASNIKKSGASWFLTQMADKEMRTLSCKTADELYSALANSDGEDYIELTGNEYVFDRPLTIDHYVQISGNGKKEIRFSGSTPALFVLSRRANLVLANMNIDAAGLKTESFIGSDTAGSSEHYTFFASYSIFNNLAQCDNFFKAAKSTFADSIYVSDCVFNGVKNVLVLNEEKDNKGYYNAEKLVIKSNKFINVRGSLLDIYRGGNDESTLGPDLSFINNTITDCNSGSSPLIQFTGVQKTRLMDNVFNNSNQGNLMIVYKDTVRALHILQHNAFNRSGEIRKNEYVVEGKKELQKK